jgi:hypothetical protein
MSPELSRDSLLRLTAEGERMIARVARVTGQPERFTSGEYRWAYRRVTRIESQPAAGFAAAIDIERDDPRVVGLVA